MNNEKIAKVFDQLAIQFKKDRYRSRAYRNAASVLRTHPGNILSGAEAMKIKGIGKSIGDKIDEIISTGTLSIIEERDPSLVQKDNAIKIFEKIHGVGPVTAEKWYDMGHRTLEDLRSMYNQMTDAQKMGYYYYHQLNLRIPRAEMNEFAKVINKSLHDHGITHMICGSYRRGEADSGDIDCLIRGDENVDMGTILKVLVGTGIIIGQLAYGSSKYMGICRLKSNTELKYNARRIDLMIIASESWPYATLYFTGSKKLNVIMRSKALEYGYTMNEYGMVGSNKGSNKGSGNNLEQNISATTEKDIFNFLGMKYLEPNQRSIGHK